MIYPSNQKPPIWSIDSGIIAYNCLKYGMPYPILTMPTWEGAGGKVFDYSKHRNHGTLNGATWAKKGIDYGGTSDYVGIPNFVRPANTTIFAEILSRSVTETNGCSVVGADDTGEGERSWQFKLDQTTGYLNFIIFTAGGVYADTVGSTNLSDQKWHTVAGSYDGETSSIYEDGVLTDSDGAMSGDLLSGTGIAIGRNSDIRDAVYFDGFIGVVIIFNTALTAVQHKFLSANPYFMYQIPEELYGYVEAPPVTFVPKIIMF